MRFRLSKVSENRVIAKFHVLDEAKSVVGSISVPKNQADDLVRSWAGAKDIEPPQRSAAAMASRLKRVPLAKAKAAIPAAASG
jgi:hypothetical protein